MLEINVLNLKKVFQPKPNKTDLDILTLYEGIAIKQFRLGFEKITAEKRLLGYLSLRYQDNLESGTL